MADTRRTTNSIEKCLGGPSNSTSTEESCQGTSPKVVLQIAPDGREVFLPRLDLDRGYQITVQGGFTYTYPGEAGLFWQRVNSKWADAMCSTDKHGNFRKFHNWLKLGGIQFWTLLNAAGAMPEEDREQHEYTVRIDGKGEKIAARLEISRFEKPISTAGFLTLTVQPLPEGAFSPRTARIAEEIAKRAKVAAEERAKLERKAAEESAKAALQAAREDAVRKSKLEGLRLQARRESNFLDAEFQEQYVRYRMKSTSRRLVGWSWEHEYDEFMRDVRLRELAKQDAPEVLEWFEARMKIVQLSERISIASPEHNDKKKTPEEVRTLILRKEEIKVDDSIARTKLKAEKIREAKAVLDSLDLDPEERERLETELVAEILEHGGENNGNNSVTL